LAGARLTGANLEACDLGKANLESANLSHAELGHAYLGGARLKGANLSNADLTEANLEEAGLIRAILVDVELTGAKLPKANLSGASLLRGKLGGADLTGANLSEADLRLADMARATLTGAILTGAKVGQAILTGAELKGLVAEWVDTSPEGDLSRRVERAQVVAALTGEIPSVPESPGRRYFGKGDVLRNASLEFGERTTVEIDSRFERCSITLGTGTELVVGEAGILDQCTINGAGDITLHGRFVESKNPGIIGPRTLVVSARGTLIGTVQQTQSPTRFAFEPGCRLRMKIMRPNGTER
jgi:uncharacterized protein YjbI with pentapeptide repeats